MKGFNSQKFLAVYSGVLTLVFSVVLLSGFTSAGQGPRFDTITVQRINVVEPDGTLRMVLSNNNRVPSVIINAASMRTTAAARRPRRQASSSMTPRRPRAVD